MSVGNCRNEGVVKLKEKSRSKRKPGVKYDVKERLS